VSSTVLDKLQAHSCYRRALMIPASNTGGVHVLRTIGIPPGPRADGKGDLRKPRLRAMPAVAQLHFLKNCPRDDLGASDGRQPFGAPLQVTEGRRTDTRTRGHRPSGTAGIAPAHYRVRHTTTADSSVEELLELLDSSPASTATAMPHQPLAEPESPRRCRPPQSPPDTTPVQAVTRRRRSIPVLIFSAWLRQSIPDAQAHQSKRTPKALVHTVADTRISSSPGVFQRYAQEHPQVTALANRQAAGWQWITESRLREAAACTSKQASGD